jgi:hypothetical protein
MADLDLFGGEMAIPKLSEATIRRHAIALNMEVSQDDFSS